jgi:hypothetical protein
MRLALRPTATVVWSYVTATNQVAMEARPLQAPDQGPV